MSYFQNVRMVPYRFGKSETITLHQDLSVYVDIVDQVRDNASFYRSYTILDGDRPDNLSSKLYKSSKHYWTFFLMNDKLREQGWPLTNQEVLALVQKERADITLTTRADITNKFKIGSTVTGISSGSTGIVVQRHELLGQIVVRTTSTFNSTETITAYENEILVSAVLVGVVPQYNSVHHYEDGDGVWADINPYTTPGVEFSAVSYYDRYVRSNNALKDIIIIKPDVIGSVFEQFQTSMRTS